MAHRPLDLAYQTQLLVDTIIRFLKIGEMSLLVNCPEWDVLGLVQPLVSPVLRRTQLSLISPLVQRIYTQEAVARWSEIVLLPYFPGLSIPEREVFDRLNADVLVPMTVNGIFTGIMVLGARASGTPYRDQELSLLTAIARAAATNIEDARLFAIQRARVAELELDREEKLEYDFAIRHQLKTPMSAIKAASEMLMGCEVRSLEFRDRLISAIVRGVGSLDRLVTELTQYGKMQNATLELKKEEVSLVSIVTDTCALLQPLAEDKRLRLTVQAPLNLPLLEVDSHRIQQILFNLITNAIKFTPAGGDISVRINRNRHQLITEVQDNGQGIPEARKGRIFETVCSPSETSNGLTGSGLGLAIAKVLTELHGGNLWVESQEGEGSTFFFSIPLKS